MREGDMIEGPDREIGIITKIWTDDMADIRMRDGSKLTVIVTRYTGWINCGSD